MVVIDQLRISDDGLRIYLNLHVNRASYYDRIYLDSITIMTSDKVLETNPVQPAADSIYYKQIEGNVKELELVLQPTDMNELFSKSNFSSDLFFIYIKVKGTPDPCIPCGLDEEITLAVTFDDQLLYQKVMQLTKNLLADHCEIPVAFSDFILLWNAFKAAIETEHYIPAIRFWNMLFDKGNISGITGLTKNCGCHG